MKSLNFKAERNDSNTLEQANFRYVRLSTNEIQVFKEFEPRQENRSVYDISNLVPGVVFRHVRTSKHGEHVIPTIKSLYTDDLDHITIVWESMGRGLVHDFTFTGITDTPTDHHIHGVFVNLEHATRSYPIFQFPLAETNDQWIDRMYNDLTSAARAFEQNIGSIQPSFYMHADTPHKKPDTSEMGSRRENITQWPRLIIGYLWNHVRNAATQERETITRHTKTNVERWVLFVRNFMTDSDRFRDFVFNSNQYNWQTARLERRIHLPTDDNKIGELVKNINDLHTSNGVLDDSEANATVHIHSVQNYRLAANNKNYKSIIERTYTESETLLRNSLD